MLKKSFFLPKPINFSCLISVLVLTIGLLSGEFVEAADYVRYVDTDISDKYFASASPDCNNYSPEFGGCGGGNAKAYRSLRDVNKFLSALSSSDTAVVYFKRDKIWTFTSNDDVINIRKSNVTLDAFGDGNKPVLDGNNQYPTGVTASGIPYRFAIIVGEGAGQIVKNVSIRNLRIQNMSPGGGIKFSGTASSQYFQGPGEVKDCELFNIGWSGIAIYRVPNDQGPSGAIIIENNYLDKIMTYRRLGSQGIQSNDGYSYGHECRYNRVERVNNSGIGAGGFRIVEYNMVSNCDGPSIYVDHATGGGLNFSQVVRYNFIWEKSSGEFAGHSEIRIDDERGLGDNTNTEIEVYGNIVVGGYAGISIRNNPTDGKGWSPFGSIKVYNNSFIDNKYNILTKHNERFNHVEIKNNAFIINSDVESSCTNSLNWSSGSWANWSWGPNLFVGKSLPNSPIFRFNVDASSDTSVLTKESGWRKLTSLNNFSFSDFYPRQDSLIIDNPTAERLSSDKGYQIDFLTNGTIFEKLPVSSKILKVNQEKQGRYWDFGAVVFNHGKDVSLSSPYRF
jgi:hypothetical protein